MMKRETYWHIFVDAWKLTREGLALPWDQELDKWDDWCRRVKELREEYPRSRLAKVLAVEIVNDVMEAKKKDYYEKETTGFNSALMDREYPMRFCPNCGADMRGEQDG